MYVIQSKRWNQNESRCECKESDDWESCKHDFMWNPNMCDWECNKACKTDEYLDTKNRSCEKILIGKLVLECEDEMLDATENLVNDKTVACAKSNSISVVIMSLLLCVSCYFNNTQYWSNKPYHDIILNQGKLDIKNVFFFLSELSFTNIHDYRAAGEESGYLFKSFLTLSLTSHTTKCDFIVSPDVNEISLTVNTFY